MPARGLALRLGGYYGAVFGVGGILLPFWPTWLAARGLAASEIGVLLAAAMIARILATPLIARVADRTGERKRLIVALALASLACWCLFPLASGFWGLLVIGVLAQGCSGAGMPLAEDLTLAATRAHRLDYGRIRLTGSVTFLLVAWAGGLVLAGRPPDLVLGLMILLVGCVLAAACLLPDLRASERLAIDFRGGLGAVLRRPGLRVLFLASGLIQASHMLYYGFGTIGWRAAGLGDGFIGFLWAEGVLAEIVLFWYGGAVVQRLGAARLVMIGGAAGTLRWLATGLTDDPLLLVAAQALHGISFGATHLGAMHYLRAHAPAGLSATTQALHSALAMGLIGGATMMASGPLHGALGAAAYHVMAAMALGGVALGARLARLKD